jgi:predicted short-subunit dehydrogenase-like oxidoreductase (DUF2520 family)
MRVVIIGSGNVATVLGRLIKNAGHEIVQVYSREIVHAGILGRELQCSFIDKSENIDKSADIYLFALSDVALYELERHFHFGNKLTIHTAGSVSKNVLEKVSSNYGVLYPLQSLRKEIGRFPEIPLSIDANNGGALTILTSFAKTISSEVRETTDEQRSKLHVAAVVVSNFTNHLFALASDYCREEYVDFKLLLPLIDETVERIHTYSPNDMQTGPAARNDTVTLDKHFKLLANFPKLKYIYIRMTESIIGR